MGRRVSCPEKLVTYAAGIRRTLGGLSREPSSGLSRRDSLIIAIVSVESESTKRAQTEDMFIAYLTKKKNAIEFLLICFTLNTLKVFDEFIG